MSEATGDKRPLWRQPLVHFLLAGAAIFALNALRGAPAPAGGDRIVVTVSQVERIAGLWRRTWGRPPSEGELQALVRDYIKEEIYYREALKLGLDVNDTVIRRRLRQKMEFLTTDAVEAAQSDDTVIRAYFEKNAEKYRTRPVYDFEQIYFSGDDRARLRRSLALLKAGEAPSDISDPIGLPDEMTRADEADIARTFGSAFYSALAELAPGEWAGPVVSGFGLHLVRVNQKEPARLPALDVVRARVENDWRAQQRAAVQDAAFEDLRAGYKIDIEEPEE